MKTHPRPSAIRALAFGVAGLFVCAACFAEPDARPNILVILVDDMGYGDLSCFGSKQIATPHIDALAGAGVRCTQGYVSGAVCSPSRAGLLTGRYQNRFGYEHNLTHPEHVNPEYLAIPHDEKLISDHLRAAGYHTALIGKWHLGQSADWHLPNARGFDYFFGMLKGNHNYFPKPDNNQLWRNNDRVKQIDVPYLTDWFTQETLDFIDRTPAGQPWFCYLSYNTPHTPLQAKEEDLAKFAHIADKRRRTYAAMQHCLDESVAKIVKHLKDTGQFDNTLIVFFSDNGGPCQSNASINAPLWGQKGMLHEGGIRVPYIVTWPKRLPAGKTYDQPFIALDLLPTFLAAAGVDAESTLNPKKTYDGVDLLPYLRGEKGEARPHDTLYWRAALKNAAIRDGDWKLLRLPHRPPQLFNLAEDVSERHDLAAEHPQLVTKLMRKLNDWELTFQKQPVFMTSVYWSKQNRKKYESQFQITQPE